MTLFKPTGGYWLFYISAVYLVAGLWGIYSNAEVVWLSPLYVLFLSMPFWFPPLGRAINLSVDWDRKMFDWFKKKTPEASNVVPFPKPEAVPYIEPPKEPERPATVFYRLGVTDNNRLAFSMGYSEITMNRQGVQNLIDQLAFFRDQLELSDD